MDATPPDPTDSNPYEALRGAIGPPRKAAVSAVSILRKVAVALLVTLAGLIAFVATCFPIGYAGMSTLAGAQAEIAVLVFACIVGAGVAVAVVRFILKARKPRRNSIPAPTDEADLR